jgi:hypothetical protein
MSVAGLVSRVLPVHTAVRNCTRDEGGPFEVNQVLTSSHRKLLSSKAMVVNERRDKIPAGKVERGERKSSLEEVAP